MGHILLPPVRAQMPDIAVLNRGHSVGRKLKYGFVPGLHQFNIGASPFQVATPPQSAGTFRYGRAGVYTGAASAIASIANETAYPFVLVWAGRFNNAGVNARVLEPIRSAGSGDNHAIRLSTSTQVDYLTRNNFSSTATVTITVPGGTAVGVDLVMVAQSLSATDHRLYCAGISSSSSTDSGTPAGNFNQLYLALAAFADHSTYFAGFGAGQALSDAEALELSRGVYNVLPLLQPARRRIWAFAPVNAYTLTADQGSYALTGQDVALTVPRTLAADAGSYALTGQTTALFAARVLVAAQGSYSLNGNDALADYVITMGQGSYTLTGQDVALIVGRAPLAAAQGSYALNGQDIGLVYGIPGAYTLVMGQGSYTLSGQDVGLAGGRLLSMGQGNYALTGQDVTFLRPAVLAAAAGSYSLTGQALTLSYSAAGIFTAESRIRVGPQTLVSVARRIGTSVQ